MSYLIAKLKCISSRLAVVFAQSIKVRCYIENEDVLGAAPTGDAPTTTEQSGRSPKVVALFSATNFSSNIIELLQLHDTIQI